MFPRFQPEADAVVWATKGQGIFANKAYNKHQLKLFPFGNLSWTKENDKKAMAKSSCVLRIHTTGQDHLLQIANPKLDLEKQQGTAVAFFAVQATEPDNPNITMEFHTHKEDGHSFPFLRNTKKLSRGDQLLVAKTEEGSQAAKENQKTKKARVSK